MKLRTHRRLGDERGAVAGAETLAIGLLVLIATTLAFTGVWALVETRVALDAAAREYLRVYTQSPDGLHASVAAERAAHEVLTARGTPLSGMEIDAPDASRFGPCQAVSVVLSTEVALVRVPFFDDVAARRVQVTHSELIASHREMTPGHAYRARDTPCGDP